MRVYLTGFMGAGKSTVGRLLAERLGCPFVDLDRRIEESAGRTIPEIFAGSGEEEFRRLESEELRRVGEEGEAVVVATGGGTVTSAGNRRLIRSRGLSVWLRPPFAVVARRIAAAGAGGRPLFEDAARAEALYRSRLPAYRRSDLELAVPAGETPEETAERVRRALAGLAAESGPGEDRCAT